MTATSASGSIGSERLDRAILEFLEGEGKEQGKSRDALLREYPDLGAELNAFFANHDRLQALAQPTLAPNEHAPQPIAAIGATIRYFGDYELLAEIARGGMGVVYRARQKRLNRVVAIKMILAGELASPDDVRRFHAEAEAAANLEHPAIVPIFEIGEQGGQHYFSMGFVDGPSLASRLTDGPLAPREAAELLQQVAEAVHYAHGRGVIHRDLKPANILLDRQGQPRITDFGLAKRVKGDSGMTATGQILGTPSYMPPEQAAGRTENVRETADVYSLGAVLYAMLTGRPPFQADNPLDTLLQVLEREPVSPRTLNPKVPLDLETICLKCLAKDRRHRYASALALTEELQRFLDGKAILARPISRPARVWRWCQRNPVVAGLMAAIALLLVAGTVVSSYFAIESNARATAEAKARKQAIRSLFSAQMNLAQRDWEEADIGHLLERLEATRPEQTAGEELRGFEWHYLQRLCHSNLLTIKLKEHLGEVLFSSDGKRLASVSRDGAVTLWDAATGEETRTLKGHTARVTSVAFSPDHQWLASASVDGMVKLWDAATGEETFTFKGHTARVTSVAFGPDGQRLASASVDGTVKLWDAVTGQETLTLHGRTGFVLRMSFSPDGKEIATLGEDQTVKLWDAAGGQETRNFTIKEHTKKVGLTEITSAAFSTDLKRLAVPSDLAVKLWDVATGQETLTLSGHTARVWSVAFSPAGDRLASASADGTVKLWDTTTGQETLTLKGHDAEVTKMDEEIGYILGHDDLLGGRNSLGVLGVAFSPDGKRLVSVGWDKTIRVWDATRSQEAITLKGHGRNQVVRALAFSPDGTLLASGSHEVPLGGTGTAKIWNTATGEATFTLKVPSGNHVQCIAYSPDGRRLALGFNYSIVIWDAATAKEMLTLNGHTTLINTASFSPDGTRLASAGGDGIAFWDAASGQEARTCTINGPISNAAFSPDDKRLASVSKDGIIKVWDTASGRHVLTLQGNTGNVQCLTFNPDGRVLASGSVDGTVKLWDAVTGQQTLTVKGHAGAVTSVAFSPDGKRIASGSLDRTVKLWDTASGQEVLTLKEHTSMVACVTFSPDGTRLASGCWDGTIKVWDATPRP